MYLRNAAKNYNAVYDKYKSKRDWSNNITEM